ncbi:MAG: hypothetical protein ACXABY_20780 [Candidatus Thorarchaeota archaeon]|jgi:hypothetical protein
MGLTNKEEFNKKLQEFDKALPVNRQVRALEDIADMTQDLLGKIEDGNKEANEFVKDLGPTLVDMRESLQAIRHKTTPKAPNHTKPVIEALKRVEGAIDKIEFSPNIKVDAPQIGDIPPSVVDLKGVEEAVASVGEAVQVAIASIPQVEIPGIDLEPLVERQDETIEQLKSIDTATRLKAQPKVYKTNSENQLEVEVAAGLVPESYDEITLTYVASGDGAGEIETVVYGEASSTIATLTLSYDTSDRLSNVLRS